MIDEPLVAPVSPGAALARLAQVSGALQRHPHIAGALPEDAARQLREKRDGLLRALESGERDAVAGALRAAQSGLLRLYETVCQPGLWPEEQAGEVFATLKFPDPLRPGVRAVDVSTVAATFSRPPSKAGPQILTTLSFEDAPGATAYWLREIRDLRGEKLDDHLVESFCPVFTRLRLSSGPHRFRIESRNSSESAASAEFDIEVPREL